MSTPITGVTTGSESHFTRTLANNLAIYGAVHLIAARVLVSDFREMVCHFAVSWSLVRLAAIRAGKSGIR
jgi:hypothetical protein